MRVARTSGSISDGDGLHCGGVTRTGLVVNRWCKVAAAGVKQRGVRCEVLGVRRSRRVTLIPA